MHQPIWVYKPGFVTGLTVHHQPAIKITRVNWKHDLVFIRQALRMKWMQDYNCVFFCNLALTHVNGCDWQVYFYPDMDIILLKEVNAINPYRNPGKWAEVEERANDQIQKLRENCDELTARTCQDHCDLLVKHFNEKNNKMLNKWVHVCMEGVCVCVCVHVCTNLFVVHFQIRHHWTVQWQDAFAAKCFPAETRCIWEAEGAESSQEEGEGPEEKDRRFEACSDESRKSRCVGAFPPGWTNKKVVTHCVVSFQSRRGWNWMCWLERKEKTTRKVVQRLENHHLMGVTLQNLHHPHQWSGCPQRNVSQVMLASNAGLLSVHCAACAWGRLENVPQYSSWRHTTNMSFIYSQEGKVLQRILTSWLKHWSRCGSVSCRLRRGRWS